MQTETAVLVMDHKTSLKTSQWILYKVRFLLNQQLLMSIGMDVMSSVSIVMNMFCKILKTAWTNHKTKRSYEV